MADTQTKSVADTAYRSTLKDAFRSNRAENQRAAAVDAALELLHAAALGGSDQFSKSYIDSVAGLVAPLADAIEAAMTSETGAGDSAKRRVPGDDGPG